MAPDWCDGPHNSKSQVGHSGWMDGWMDYVREAGIHNDRNIVWCLPAHIDGSMTIIALDY